MVLLKMRVAELPTGQIDASEVWSQPLAELLSRLATSEAGLASADAEARLQQFGRNDAATAKPTPLWLQFLSRFRSPLVIILLIASALSAVTGDIVSFGIVMK